MKLKILKWMFFFTLCCSTGVLAQGPPVEKRLSVEELFKLTIENHPHLKVSEKDILILLKM